MKKIESEDHVKDMVRQWFDSKGAFSWCTVQNGLGIHGIHDRTGVVPLVVTPAMVGKRIGLLVSVEAKAPGRRTEQNRGMSKHQVLFWEGVTGAGGLSICCDGQEDLDRLEVQIAELMGNVWPS
jgi:hypothetical protein